MSTLIDLDIGISTLHRIEFAVHVARHSVAHIPKVEVVRRADKNSWVFPGLVLRPIDVRSHALSVTHRNHQLALNDRNGFEFLFALVALRDLFRRQPGALLSRDWLMLFRKE